MMVGGIQSTEVTCCILLCLYVLLFYVPFLYFPTRSFFLPFFPTFIQSLFCLEAGCFFHPISGAPVTRSQKKKKRL